MPGSNRLSIVERIDYISVHIMLALRSETMPQSYLVFVEEPGDLFGAVVFSMPEASQTTYSCYLLLHVR